MKTYKVQQKAEVWYEVEVEANSRAEACNLASDKVMHGEGTVADGGLTWVDEFWTDKDEDGEDEQESDARAIATCECETPNIHDYWHDCGAEECYALECLDCQAFTTLCEKENN